MKTEQAAPLASPRRRGTEATHKAHLQPHIVPQGPEAELSQCSWGCGQTVLGSGLCCRWAALALLPPGPAALPWPREQTSLCLWTMHGRSQHPVLSAQACPHPRADVKSPSTFCYLGRPLAWVRVSSETRLLLRQRGTSVPTSP